jgi:hypothetical protein
VGESQARAAPGAAKRQPDDMIAWMTQNRCDWNQWNRGWMMNGSMIGR